jgi:MerR family transcriptional regulator, light-induced transcriptional regulator
MSFREMSGINGHPITVASARTGLSQDVLRVWERRYGAVVPGRSPGGQRVYSDADIERLRLLHSVTRAGRAIRAVAQLSTEELARLAAEDATSRAQRTIPASNVDANEVVDRALEHARRLASDDLGNELRRALARFGLVLFMEQVCAPLMRRIGEEWHGGRLSPAQEHHATATIQDIIASTMRGLAISAGTSSLLVATLPGERHAIGAAMVAAAAASEGWRVLYLGTDLPAPDIAFAAIEAGVDAVAISVVFVEDRRGVSTQLAELRSALPANVKVLVGGSAASVIAIPEAVQLVESLSAMREFMRAGV